MKAGRKIQFPQLLDEDWIRHHLNPDAEDLGVREISTALQCSTSSVEKALRRFGIRFRQRHWSQFEKATLEGLYPYYPTYFLTQALNRTRASVWRRASRLSIGRLWDCSRADPQEKAEFWVAWQDLVRWGLLAYPNERDLILGLTWSPPEWELRCETCRFRPSCRGEGALPCERTTIKDHLERTRTITNTKGTHDE